MINSQFNQDVNFTRGQFDIKELNAFMNDKKRKIDKELTKYDVDHDTQAKAQKVQHLSQMAQYLPLFTKRIKDPKAIKNQKITKDLDYTKASTKEQLQKQQVIVTPRDAALGIKKASQLIEQPIKEQALTERLIRDPSPRIVNKATYEGRIVVKTAKRIGQGKRNPVIETDNEVTKQSIENAIDDIQMKIPVNPRKQSNESIENFIDNMQTQIHLPLSKPRKELSPEKKRSNNDDILGQVSLVDQENQILKHQVQEQKAEYENLTFKHAKAQSKFIEIMRELSRFRDEFNDQYSIRSKMLKVLDVTKSIDNLLDIKEYMFKNEQQTLQKFKYADSMLLEAKDSQFATIESTQNDQQSNQMRAIINAGLLLAKQCTIKPGRQVSGSTARPSSSRNPSGTKMVRVGNQICFSSYVINKQKAECTITLKTQISHESLTYVFTKITEKFDLENEIEQLRFVIQRDNSIKLESSSKIQTKLFLPFDQTSNSIYAGIDNQIVKYIHGAPQRLWTIDLKLITLNQKIALQLSIQDLHYQTQLYSVEVSEDKLFKDLSHKSLEGRNYMSELKSLVFKKHTVMDMISKYIKRHLQVVTIGVHIKDENQQPNIDLVQQTPTQIGVVDREVRNLKFRHTDFPGLRVQSNAISQINPPNATLPVVSNKNKPNVTLHQRKHSNQGAVHRSKSDFAVSQELMRQAVQEYIQSKRDKNANQNNIISQSTSPKTKESNASLKISQHLLKDLPKVKASQSSLPVVRPKITNDDHSTTKMQQIMQLIQANSMFNSIHSELFIHTQGQSPSYLEIIHNTDDDTLVLYLVEDSQECVVNEYCLTELQGTNWHLIQQRFANNIDQFLANIETMFRSIEFLQIVLSLIRISRNRRNSSQLSSVNTVNEDGEVVTKSPNEVRIFTQFMK